MTQQSHPRLWLVFQALFGATRDKQRIALSFLEKRKRVLEIGCSLGVVAAGFKYRTDIDYLGIDIDSQAIRHAKNRFGGIAHMRFEAQSLEELAAAGQRFDYVLFANILHHVDDKLAVDLLTEAARTVDVGGVIVIMEPDVLQPADSWLVRTLYRLERGQYRRPLSELLALAQKAGINLAHTESRDISIGLLPGLTGGHMLIMSGSV